MKGKGNYLIWSRHSTLSAAKCQESDLSTSLEKLTWILGWNGSPESVHNVYKSQACHFS